IKRITGLPDVINHLTYSKDGKFLVAGLGSDGIRIFKAEDYSLLREDKAYGDSVYGMDFSIDGRLVVSSFDGYIRLYDRSFNIIKKKKAPGGKNPFHVSFSPDGTKIAVGYADSKNVDILSGDDLSHLYSADTEGLSECDNLGSVTFSSGYLYAGGGCFKLDLLQISHNVWKSIIRRWERAGKGGYIDIPVVIDIIMHILPLKNGGIVFGSYEPSFGIVDASGRLALYKKSEIAYFGDLSAEFRISYDGSMVRFGYEIFGGSPVIFDVEKGEFIPGEAKGFKLFPPITEHKEIKVTDWRDNSSPKLNGRAIELKQYEFSRSLAIAPDGEGFILGTDWYLRAYDKKGKELWKVPSPASGVVEALNISNNGKVVVAGFSDGTIRWYRRSDGKELLALFPHGDKRRFIAWTPKGYFTAGPDSEELIGWHINNGKDKEADFFPASRASRFRERFYRPDIIARLFTVYDEERAIALANKESGRKPVETNLKDILPPVITIVSPADGSSITSTSLVVRYSIKDLSGEPVT
ncbi:MAG: WD40 repeat domain-containing protein, partial [Leptonema sp. (in: bacteria)]